MILKILEDMMSLMVLRTIIAYGDGHDHNGDDNDDGDNTDLY